MWRVSLFSRKRRVLRTPSSILLVKERCPKCCRRECRQLCKCSGLEVQCSQPEGYCEPAVNRTFEKARTSFKANTRRHTIAKKTKRRAMTANKTCHSKKPGSQTKTVLWKRVVSFQRITRKTCTREDKKMHDRSIRAAIHLPSTKRAQSTSTRQNTKDERKEDEPRKQNRTQNNKKQETITHGSNWRCKTNKLIL